ncbi:MAG: MATE family efflux transporter [Candidatus Zixiibacteriota bacterium]
MENSVQTNSDRITSGPITGAVFHLAIPVVLGMLMEIALSVTNFFWVGRLGPAAQDAITSSMVVHWTAFATLSIITIGLTALVSRHTGAREPDQAAYYVRQGIWMSLFHASFMVVLGISLTPTLLKFMQTGQETTAMALPYLYIFFIAILPIAIAEALFAAFRAVGDTRTPMWIMGTTVVVNMILDPVLIFGLGPFPEWGVKGAAVSTLISVTLACILISSKVMKGKLGFSLTGWFKQRPDLSAMRKIAKIGAPITTQAITFIVVYWFLIRIVHQYGEAAGAAMGIGNRMESISYLTCSGFSMAAATLVGQNLGAKNPARAERCAWISVSMAILVTLVIGAIYVVVPGLISGIFTNDPQVHKIASDYLMILGLSQFTMAIEIVLEGSFSGAGDTMPPMLVSIPGAVMRVPLAYYLCFDLNWGINGVWWTLTITTTLKAAALALWFRRGKWKLKKV